MNKILLKIGASALLLLAIGIGAKFVRKKIVINSKEFIAEQTANIDCNAKLIPALFKVDSLHLVNLNYSLQEIALKTQKDKLQAKVDTFTKYNKACYQKVLESKGFLKKKTWVFVEIPCSKIY
jgi:hypothetical protein